MRDIIMSIIYNILSLWDYFRGKKQEKRERVKQRLEDHDEQVDKQAKEKIDKVKNQPTEEEQAKGVSQGLDDYFGGSK